MADEQNPKVLSDFAVVIDRKVEESGLIEEIAFELAAKAMARMTSFGTVRVVRITEVAVMERKRSSK
jgi:hypothetical protein